MKPRQLKHTCICKTNVITVCRKQSLTWTNYFSLLLITSILEKVFINFAQTKNVITDVLLVWTNTYWTQFCVVLITALFTTLHVYPQHASVRFVVIYWLSFLINAWGFVSSNRQFNDVKETPKYLFVAEHENALTKDDTIFKQQIMKWIWIYMLSKWYLMIKSKYNNNFHHTEMLVYQSFS